MYSGLDVDWIGLDEGDSSVLPTAGRHARAHAPADLLPMGGSTFRHEGENCTLGRRSEPVARQPHADPRRVSHDGGGHGSIGPAPRRILLVDDNADAAESLAMILDDLGFEVTAVDNGPAALQAAVARRPDVVLLDIGMPGMDGFEVARRLRRMRSLAGILLVAVTGYSHDEYRWRSREAGFDHHLVKPVDIEVLCRVIATRA